MTGVGDDATPGDFCERLLDVVERDIVPRTRAGVAAGNKAFGAAILRKSDLSLVVAGANRETENPLLHGEIATLNAFFALPAGERPNAAACHFLTVHESCPMCLSAITWAGFDNFYYLFDYAATRDRFGIPHNLKIHREVFGLADGGYARRNGFWRCHDLAAMAAAAPGAGRLRLKIARIEAAFADLSDAYQRSKSANDIPLK